MSKTNKLILKIFLGFIVFIIIPLFAVEIIMRIFFPVEHLKPVKIPPEDVWNKMIHRASEIPGLIYELNPNTKKEWNGFTYKINSEGMRDDEPMMETTQTLHRVAVLGDSFAMGYFVDQKYPFPMVLERMMNSLPTTGTLEQFDFLNFAVDGYSTRQEAIVFETKCLQYKPDLVIIGYVLNDPENDPLLPEVSRTYYKTLWWQHSHLLRALYIAKTQWQVKKYGGGDYLKYLHNKDFSKWKSVPEAFEKIRKIANENGVNVLVAMLPVIPENNWSEYPYLALHEQVLDAARACGFYTVDIYSEWSKVNPGAKLWTNPNDRHPNNIGHQLIAFAIKRELIKHYHDFFDKDKNAKRNEEYIIDNYAR